MIAKVKPAHLIVTEQTLVGGGAHAEQAAHDLYTQYRQAKQIGVSAKI